MRSETDRGTWWLVAQRDFWYRLRDKGFVISTGITLAVLTGLHPPQGVRRASGTPSFDLGLARHRVAAVAGPLVVQAADGAGGPRSARGRSRIGRRRGRARGWFGRRRVRRRRESARRTRGAARAGDQPSRTAVVADGIRTTLEANDVPARRDRADPESDPRPRRDARAADPNRETNSTVAFIAVLLLYGQLFGYGVWVATGVIEEKAREWSRSCCRRSAPGSCWRARSWGSARSGMLQLVVHRGVRIASPSLTGALDLPGHALGTALIAIALVRAGVRVLRVAVRGCRARSSRAWRSCRTRSCRSTW